MVLDIAEYRKRVYLVDPKDLRKALLTLLQDCSIGNFYLVFNIMACSEQNLKSALATHGFIFSDSFLWASMSIFFSHLFEFFLHVCNLSTSRHSSHYTSPGCMLFTVKTFLLLLLLLLLFSFSFLFFHAIDGGPGQSM